MSFPTEAGVAFKYGKALQQFIPFSSYFFLLRLILVMKHAVYKLIYLYFFSLQLVQQSRYIGLQAAAFIQTINFW